MNNKFDLGRIVVTAGVDARMKEDNYFRSFVNRCLVRYEECDWGSVDPEDKKTSDDAVKNGDRIMGVYEFVKDDKNLTIWIITERDRSVTTILFPHEY